MKKDSVITQNFNNHVNHVNTFIRLEIEKNVNVARAPLVFSTTTTFTSQNFGTLRGFAVREDIHLSQTYSCLSTKDLWEFSS